jgi:hypothetical protein
MVVHLTPKEGAQCMVEKAKYGCPLTFEGELSCQYYLQMNAHI